MILPFHPTLPSGLTRFIALAVLLLSLDPLMAEPLQRPASRLYVDFSARPAPAHLLAFDIAFLNADAEAELGPGRALGHTYYAQLKTVFVAPETPAGTKARSAGLVVESKDSGWNDLLLDVLHPQWIAWVKEQQTQAAERGFSGFLIDGAAALAELDRLRPDQFLAHRQAFITMVTALRRAYPDKPIVLRGGFEYTAVLKDHVHGILTENIFAQEDAEKRIRKAQIAGMKVFAVEHGTPGKTTANAAAAARLERIGCSPFITTPALDGIVLGPLLPQSRHLLVLHGWDSETESRPAQRPTATWSARTLAPALAWLDLAPRYIDVTAWLAAMDNPESLFYPRPAGIVIDPSLLLAPEVQAAAAAWLAQARANDIPILLAAQPFTEPTAWTTLATALSLTGNGQPAASSSRTSLSHYQATWFLPGQVPDTRALRPRHLKSPQDATHLLSYRLTSTEGPSQTFDAGFLADWGGAWLDASSRTPIDLFRFLEAALQRESAGPVPDTTTLGGHRIFLSTVQGRGFCEPSWKAGSPFCGELLQAELAKYPNLPTTIALSEADVRGWSPDANPADALRYETAARALFSLPHIEPAANSLSRPIDWSAEAFQPGSLRDLIPDQRTGIEREISGSLAYLKRRVVPPGKYLRFFLWPEGAVPSQAAIDHLDTTGAAHLPGSWQSGWNIAPVTASPVLPPDAMPIQEKPGTAAAIAASWLQTQTQTETETGSRRLNPVHLAYAFADLKKTATLEALRQIWSWCAEQPFHPMTASTYAALTRDAAEIQVIPVQANHWLIVSSGRPATLRLATARGLPDLTRSSGITGYTTHQGQTYIHLGGQPLSELILRPASQAAPRHLHLVQADRLLDFYELHSQTARFRTQGRTTAIVTLGGLIPGDWYQITASGNQTRLQANPAGQLTLRAPALATVSITPAQELGKPYAAR